MASIGIWFLPLILALAGGLLAGFGLNFGLRNSSLPARVRHGLAAVEVLVIGGALFYVLLQFFDVRGIGAAAAF